MYRRLFQHPNALVRQEAVWGYREAIVRSANWGSGYYRLCAHGDLPGREGIEAEQREGFKALMVLWNDSDVVVRCRALAICEALAPSPRDAAEGMEVLGRILRGDASREPRVVERAAAVYGTWLVIGAVGAEDLPLFLRRLAPLNAGALRMLMHIVLNPRCAAIMRDNAKVAPPQVSGDVADRLAPVLRRIFFSHEDEYSRILALSFYKSVSDKLTSPEERGRVKASLALMALPDASRPTDVSRKASELFAHLFAEPPSLKDVRGITQALSEALRELDDADPLSRASARKAVLGIMSNDSAFSAVLQSDGVLIGGLARGAREKWGNPSCRNVALEIYARLAPRVEVAEAREAALALRAVLSTGDEGAKWRAIIVSREVASWLDLHEIREMALVVRGLIANSHNAVVQDEGAKTLPVLTEAARAWWEKRRQAASEAQARGAARRRGEDPWQVTRRGRWQ